MYAVWLGHGFLGRDETVVAWKADSLKFGSFEEAESALKDATKLYDPEDAWPHVVSA